MKNFLLALALILVGHVATAQTASVTSSSLSTNWTSVTAKDGVEILALEAECPYSDGNNQKMVTWKVVNSNNYDVLVRFNKEIYFDNICSNCSSGSTEYLSTFTLQGNTSINSDCSNYSESNVFVEFVTWENKKIFTKVDLTEFQVSKL